MEHQDDRAGLRGPTLLVAVALHNYESRKAFVATEDLEANYMDTRPLSLLADPPLAADNLPRLVYLLVPTKLNTLLFAVRQLLWTS